MVAFAFTKNHSAMRLLVLGCLLCASIVLLGASWGRLPGPSHIVVGQERFEIPAEIRRNKDCEAYREFIGTLIMSMIPVSDKCPWAKVGETGRFVLNGLTFTLPRQYIRFGSTEPDGVLTDGLYLGMMYPDFSAPDAEGEELGHKDYFRVIIEPNRLPEPVCYGTGGKRLTTQYDPARRTDRDCVSREHHIFASHSGLSEFLDNGKKEKIEDVKDIVRVIYHRYAPKTITMSDTPEGVQAYSYGTQWYERLDKTVSIKGDVFLAGDPYAPDYWFICEYEIKEGDRASSTCESHFLYKDKVWVEYRFKRQAHIANHRAIREGIIHKLDEWTEPLK